MSNDLRVSNMAFLASRFPALAHRIENHRISPGEIRPTVIQGEKIGYTASVPVNDREKFLHSKYDPVREAQRWAASQTPPNDSIVLLVGWGMGYHVLEWVKAHGKTVEAVVVFEPEPELFKSSLFFTDLRALAETKRLEIIIGCDTVAFDRSLQNLIEPLLNHDLSMLPLPFFDIYPARTTDFLKTNIQKLLHRREGILRHMAEMGIQCQEHIIRNIPAMASAHFPHAVKGMANGQPGIIVAAGPSLDRNIGSLSSARGNAWIFAVDTSLKILLERGIESHFVVTKDAAGKNEAHFEGINNLERPALIFDPQIVPGIPRRFSGPKICMPNRNHELHHCIPELRLSNGDILPHSTNVALAAFNMAVLMGCDPVIFVGLDFCFSRDGGPSHAAHSALCSETSYLPEQHRMIYQRGEAKDDIQVIEVEGIDGEMYPASPNFYESLRLLETLIQNAPVRCIDASEGGAKIAGTEIRTLDEAIQSFCATPVQTASFFERPAPGRNLNKVRDSLEAIAGHIERCGQAAQRALEALREEAGSSVPGSVIQARNEIESEYKLYRELQSALERLCVEINRPSFWDTESQKRKEWLPRYEAYFQQIQTACARFAPIYNNIFSSMGG